MNEKRKRQNYTKEFKQDAVKLVIEQRYSCPEVSRRLGVAASNVSRWVRQYRKFYLRWENPNILYDILAGKVLKHTQGMVEKFKFSECFE